MINQRDSKWATVGIIRLLLRSMRGFVNPGRIYWTSCTTSDQLIGFSPIPGAAGFQVGNPSALALTALLASLEIFSLTTMSALRLKSIALTNYLEDLLLQPFPTSVKGQTTQTYKIITPSNPAERGAQLSVRLQPGSLNEVMRQLESAGVVVDERKPDVVRVAPAPLYNTFSDVWQFVHIFKEACLKAES